MKKSVRLILATVIALAVAAIAFYVSLPALNVYNQEFWMFSILLIAAWVIPYLLLSYKSNPTQIKKSKNGKINLPIKGTALKWGLILAAIPVAVLVVGNLISSTFFNAEAYSNIIEVEEAVFEEDMPENNVVNNIALMDSDSAAILGKRALGELANADLVSQFQIGDTYSQINLGNAPAKVGNLEYADFFRWFNNRQNGVPGYVWVDPVDSNYKYVTFAQPIKYVESAYFSEDLNRKLRFSYPTKIFGEINFEVDEAGNPFYIVSCMKPRVGLFGALDVNEVIIFNPVDGTSQLYALDQTPTWVDNVFDGYLASQKYDWYGTLKQGFWNSIIGKKDCKVTTDDFGYIVRDDDVWYFTGVTSVSSDESNIGFILTNARTGQYKFYQVTGAEEYSAMRAAEGEVQEKGYVASFPSLINVSGNATYIMVLKDSGGIVKLIALVNVENYSIVATGNTQQEAKERYLELLVQNGLVNAEDVKPSEPAVETKEAIITVADLRFVTTSGNTVAYIRDEKGELYRIGVAEDESVMLIQIGDHLSMNYAATDNPKIHRLVSWSYADTNDKE